MADDEQLNLYGDAFNVARARRTDPVTSHEAAKSIKPKELTERQQAVLLVYQGEGSMSDEMLLVAYRSAKWRAFKLPKQSDSGLRTRRSELSKAGLLVPMFYGLTKAGRKTRFWATPGEFNPLSD
jgi:hypothetical protein